MLPSLPLASPLLIIVRHRLAFRAGCGFSDRVCQVCADCDEKDVIREISRQATEEISQVKK